MPILSLLLALLAPAHAGKLAQGILGQTWGPRSPFPAPGANCIPNPEPLTRWGGCDQKVGDLKLLTAWAYGHGRLYGAVIRVRDYPTCAALEQTLQAAWGPGKQTESYHPNGLARTEWADGDVLASMGPSMLPGVECEVVAVHLGYSAEVRAIEEQRAADRAAGI
jgi:hypothetical protein